ncbi:glycosylated lysosomal membrane protein [Acipenser oxyrinchus oxyrinchus]|uniref:Glycosylated lysosomal membrane protein n=1 Tax=Acipenser oxyrinchus oxyrinchus TaxID=40147 RepID=A0AAD8CHY7_ACIOX|nr:glycosylated lysosomal membrane protein [Acipenser oxyrinchus oxyrinchus]
MKLLAGLVRLDVFLYFISLIAAVQAFFGGGTNNYRRKVSLELNPDPSGSSNISVLHVRAVGSNDTLHFLWGSQGVPTLLLVHTDSPETRVQIDWARMLSNNISGSLTVEPASAVRYSTAFLFSKIWEYKENSTDQSQAAADSYFPPYSLEEFTWEDLNRTLNHSALTAELCGRNQSQHRGRVCFQISAFESWGRDPAWPRLLHNANSSQLRFLIEGVTPRSNRSRFALELLSIDSRDHEAREETHRSIDDEYTPSIFQVSQLVSVHVNSSVPVLSYAQWKPVAYRTASPVFEDSTPCRHSPASPPLPPPRLGLALAFFGGALDQGYRASAVNISFGIPGEPFYNVTGYLSWSCLLGLGSPPEDSFSPLVLGIMVVGLGTPALLLLVGGAYVCVQRLRRQQPGYAPIN